MSGDTKDPNTRERILALLRENNTVTVAGLSHAWGLTRADIRYHLNLLVQEGLAEIIPRDPNQPAGRGRPVIRYRMAAHLAPNNLPALCSTLLELYLNMQPDKPRVQALKDAALHMAGEAPAAGSLTQRMNRAVAYLNQHAYRARWEASPTGPRIILRNCPYAVILDRNPELCQFDRILLEQLSQVPFEQTAQLNPATGHPPACVFICTPTQRFES